MFFRHADEGLRRDPAVAGVFPTHEGLGADGTHRREVIDRLIVQPKLATFDRVAKVVGEVELLRCGFTQTRVVEHRAIAAGSLCAVHRKVGIAQQLLWG